MVYLPRNREITYFGATDYRGKETVFGIKRKDRRQHFYVVGKSGTGKSALLSNMLYQDIQNGYGCCVVDPHGELVEEIISAVPEDRLDDVVYFNPADNEGHMGFNILEISNPKQKNLVTSGIMGIFTKIWANTWSARMEYILNNCILALLDTKDSTLLGIPRILADKEYRSYIIRNIKDPVVKNFWTQEYESWQDKYRSEAIAPIQNKVGQFLSTEMIRNIVGQKKSTINISEIMNNEKIFLINLSKGRIGEDNSALLGGMLITKIQLAAMERVEIAEPERKDFYLYVDEFQNFVTDSFANILSEARKYRLNLTIAHQYIAQLGTFMNPVVRDAVFGNVGTMVVFRVGAQDADFLKTEFEPEIEPADFVTLPNHSTYLKLMIDGVTTRPFSAKTIPPIIKYERDLEKEGIIVSNSRKLYQKPVEEVEKEILDWSNQSFKNTEKELKSQPKTKEEGLVSIENTKEKEFDDNQTKRLKNQEENKQKMINLGIEFSGTKINDKKEIEPTSKGLEHLDTVSAEKIPLNDLLYNLVTEIKKDEETEKSNQTKVTAPINDNEEIKEKTLKKNPIENPPLPVNKTPDKKTKDTNISHTFVRIKTEEKNKKQEELKKDNSSLVSKRIFFHKKAQPESKNNLKDLLKKIEEDKSGNKGDSSSFKKDAPTPTIFKDTTNLIKKISDQDRIIQPQKKPISGAIPDDLLDQILS